MWNKRLSKTWFPIFRLLSSCAYTHYSLVVNKYTITKLYSGTNSRTSSENTNCAAACYNVRPHNIMCGRVL